MGRLPEADLTIDHVFIFDPPFGCYGPPSLSPPMTRTGYLRKYRSVALKQPFCESPVTRTGYLRKYRSGAAVTALVRKG